MASFGVQTIEDLRACQRKYSELEKYVGQLAEQYRLARQREARLRRVLDAAREQVRTHGQSTIGLLHTAVAALDHEGDG